MDIIKEIVKFLLYALFFTVFMCIGCCYRSQEDEMTDEDFFFCIILGVISAGIMYLAKWAFS